MNKHDYHSKQNGQEQCQVESLLHDFGLQREGGSVKSTD